MTTISCSDRVLTRRTLDGLVILHLDGGEPAVIRGVAVTLWDTVARAPLASDEAVAMVVAGFESPPPSAIGDLTAVLEELQRRGFVVQDCER